MLLLKLTSGSAEDVEAGLCRLYKAVLDKRGLSTEMVEAAAQRSGKACASKRGQWAAQALGILRKHYPNVALQRQPSSAATAQPQQQPQQQPIHVRFTQAVGLGTSQRKSLTRRRSQSVASDFAFIMEGPALIHVLNNKPLECMLFEIMKASSSVIGCRVSPKQKAQLVRLVKTEVVPEPVCLAIGACLG